MKRAKFFFKCSVFMAELKMKLKVCCMLQRLPLVWTGQLVLKNDVAAVRMHYVSGNQDLVRASLPPEALTQDGLGTTLSQLRISQRMRLDPSQLDQVTKRMEVI